MKGHRQGGGPCLGQHWELVTSLHSLPWDEPAVARHPQTPWLTRTLSVGAASLPSQDWFTRANLQPQPRKTSFPLGYRQGTTSLVLEP